MRNALKLFYDTMLALYVGTVFVVAAVLAGHLSGWFVQKFLPDDYFQQYPIVFAAVVLVNVAVGRLILWGRKYE